MEAKSRTFALLSCFVAVFGCILMLVFSVSHSYWGGGFSIITTLGMINNYGDDMRPNIITINIDRYENLDNLPLLSELSGLGTININRQNISDLTALNNLITYKDVTLNISGSVIDFKGLSSTKITRLEITTSFVKNIKDIENLTNLTYLKIDTISNYEDIDFSKLPNLSELVLNGVYITNFDNLFNNIPNVTSLDLSSTNLDDTNITNIKNASNINTFVCLYTYITNLNPFIGMYSLRRLALPYSVEDFSNVEELPNIFYYKITAALEKTAREDLIQYFNENDIEYSIFDTSENYDEEAATQDFITLLSQFNEEEPEEGTLEFYNYILAVVNAYNSLFDKYFDEPDHDNMAYTLLSHTDYYKVGYGIVIENGDFYKKLFHVVKDNDGNYYYLIVDEEEVYESTIFNDYDTFTGDKITFVDTNLLGYLSSKNIINSDEYVTLDEFLINVKETTSLEDFVENLGSSYEVKVYNSENEEKTSGLVGTGDVVKIYDGNTLVGEYSIVIKGDPTGDGIIDISDLTKIYWHIKSIRSMTGAYLKSSEIVLDGAIDISDLTKLYFYIKGINNSL